MIKAYANNCGKPAHGSRICWAARSLSLPAILFLAMVTANLMSQPSWLVALALVPLALLLIGWRWHLAACLPLTLLSGGLLWLAGWEHFWSKQSDAIWSGIAVSAVPIAGSLLNLVAWWRETLPRNRRLAYVVLVTGLGTIVALYLYMISSLIRAA